MEKNSAFKKLETQTGKFFIRIIRLSSTLPHTPECMAVRNQIAKGGTSIGVNYRVPKRAGSSKDFKNKINKIP